MKRGQLLWWILVSEYTIVDYDRLTDTDLKNYASVIAEYCGGTYMDYYYAYIPPKTINKKYKKYREKIMKFFKIS